WTGSDADGDALVYTLQYSRNGGATWSSLATNLSATSYNLDAASLGGTNQALVRVIASDGVHTAEDTSDATFSVSRKPPQVYLLSPAAGATFHRNAFIELDGLASDLEDGPLGDAALTWTSDRQGELGTGPNLTVMGLRPGAHTLTLRARDSDGMTSTASVTIYIGTQLWLPVMAR
ncbi:MAG: VCBS repeat-containing protein, partial [Anaerolineae bacterium]|nr:VCBS repeat-containing protein [Anaerolineae bacterium]